MLDYAVRLVVDARAVRVDGCRSGVQAPGVASSYQHDTAPFFADAEVCDFWFVNLIDLFTSISNVNLVDF